MAETPALQLNRRAYLQALFILGLLMLAAGALTRLLPAGSYQRQEIEGRQVIIADSFQFQPSPDYPIWRWLTAPLEVLAGPNALTLWVILIFLLLLGAAFSILTHSGVLQAALARVVRAFGGRKYALLLAVSFFFMSLGAFFGMFEEVVPLVPIMVALAISLGWDVMVGLGMSILATNLGFSAAITNPFTIGVAQKLAGLPLFSGASFRIPIFIAVYILYAIFIVRYARRIERAAPTDTAVAPKDLAQPISGAPITLLALTLLLIVATLFAASFVPALSDYALPIVGLLFFAGCLGAGLLSGLNGKALAQAAAAGLGGLAPAIPLILMAASIQHIVASGGILDTVLHAAAEAFAGADPFSGALLVFFVALGLEFFISSGSAKAFLVMPVLLPLGDLVGVTRQVVVTAYCFGDGFTNLAYPTSAVLLICLGLSSVSYGKWLRWTLPLWLGMFLITLFFLALGVAIGLGPA